MSATELKPRKRDPHVCMRCKSRDVLVEHYADVLDFKGLTLDVDGLAQTRCRNCDYRWTTAGQEQDNLARLRDAYVAKRDAVRDREGLLTGEQIGEVLDRLQLTKAQAAELFGGGPNAFTKYMNGEVLQSLAMDRLLRLALAFGPRAVELLRQGRNAPLRLNAGYTLGATTATAEMQRCIAAIRAEADEVLMRAYVMFRGAGTVKSPGAFRTFRFESHVGPGRRAPITAGSTTPTTAIRVSG